jgi:hypothetical protein
VTILRIRACLGALCQIPYQMTLAKGSLYAVFQSLVALPLALPLTYISIKHFGLVGSAFVYALLNRHRRILNPIVVRLYFSGWVRCTICRFVPAALLIALAFSYLALDAGRESQLPQWSHAAPHCCSTFRRASCTGGPRRPH